MSTEAVNTELCSPLPLPRKQRVILSVDDEPLVLYARYKLLEQAGYGVVCAADGVQALQVFANHPVDLVVLDYTMPGMHGGEVAQEIKKSKPDVPVVMVSAGVVPHDHLTSVDCHVMKGQDPELLLGTISNLLAAA